MQQDEHGSSTDIGASSSFMDPRSSQPSDDHHEHTDLPDVSMNGFFIFCTLIFVFIELNKKIEHKCILDMSFTSGCSLGEFLFFWVCWWRLFIIRFAKTIADQSIMLRCFWLIFTEPTVYNK